MTDMRSIFSETLYLIQRLTIKGFV